MKSRHRNSTNSDNQVIRDNDSTSSFDSSKSSFSNSFLSGSWDSESSSDERDPIIYTPKISGGCIISERPIFLKNSVICVINNRKCTLYSSYDAKRLCDTRLNPEMIIGSRSFIYESEYEILLCASSNGSILVYHVPNYINKSNFHDRDIDKKELDLIIEIRVECKNLLAIEANKETGDIICVILTNQLKTDIIRFSLDYDKILFSDSYESDINVYDDEVVYVSTSDPVSSGNNSTHLSSKGGCSSDYTMNTTSTIDKGNVNNNTTSSTYENHTNTNIRNKGHSNSNNNDKQIVQEFKRILSLESNLEVFEIDNMFNRIALGVNKSCLVVDTRSEEAYYFENDNVITCMAFDNRGSISIGDSSGQIIIISILESNCFVNTNDISTVTIPVLGFKLNDHNINVASISNYLYISKKNNNRVNKQVIEGDYLLGKVETKRLHWHSHGVNSICYNDNNANMLLSGGEEGVIVVWDLVNHSKKFVTRLGSPIFHLKISDNETILASVQNNSIFLIDTTSLSIRAKISSLIIDFPLCDGCLESRRIIDYYPSNWIKGMFAIQKTEGGSGNLANVSTGRNSIAVANMNKLQVYDYIRDCETKLIEISNVNYVSRQDEDFGQHYHITNLCVSQDCNYIVIVQSRSVKIGLEGEEHTLEENINKYILKFYHNNSNATTVGTPTTTNVLSGVERDTKNTVKTEDYILHTNINNPHNNRVTSIKELYHKNKFLSTSLDGKLNLYSLVQISDNKNQNVVEVKAAGSPSRVQWQEVWIIEHVFDYKDLPIHSLAINENNLILLKHDCAISLWKYSETYEAGLEHIRAMSLIIAQDVFYVQFVNNESVLMCTRKRIDIYNMKNNTNITVLESCDGEEVNSVLLKYDLLVVNVRRCIQNVNYMDHMEIYNINNKTKIYSKVINGINTRIDIKLLPYPVNAVHTYTRKRHRESLNRPVFKNNQIHYHLLVINCTTHDIEVISIIKEGSNYRIDDEYSSIGECKRIKRQDSHINHLATYIQNILSRSKDKVTKGNKVKYNLCNKYYKQNSYRCKRIDIESVSKLYGTSGGIPRPNVLLDHIINKLV